MLGEIANSLPQFIQDNFLYLHPGYTLLNTIVFGLILGLSVLLIIKMFKWIDKDPGDLFIPLIPFIFLGSGARALVDNGIYPLHLLLVTPGIYVMVGFTTIITLLGSVYLEKKFKWDYRYIIFIFGVILCIPNMIHLQNIDLTATIMVLGAWALFTGIFYFLKSKLDLLKEKFNLAVLSAHLFDAASTFIAVDFYGYGEQHVLPLALTNMGGTAFVMFPLKILVILLALYIIDTNIEDKTTKNTLKLSIFVLGLAPGVRNFLSLITGL
ncbi:DUF63 family protein [Methanobacterium alcaliphilum]|uniref:DUF63 family protein n=1 Tax=Methanobacterium alcaliphilum TaxID=392018 RepID=UPI00200B1F4F|nr:DUF63 family protein [Methanobacterium alcaliphilum]MCK9152369.1 DUF63 family protein [Methanobacterium alcaliphilum]